MTSTIDLLIELKHSLQHRTCSILSAQRQLSKILLRNCNSKDIEAFARRLDNQMELIMHTVPEDEQTDSALQVMDAAIHFLSSRENDINDSNPHDFE